MKKRLLLLVLLLAVTAFAGDNLETNFSKGIVRYDDFPLDNIHILRLQEAATSLGGNVSELKREMADFQQKRTGEIAQLQESMDDMQRGVTAQVASLQNSIDQMGSRFDHATEQISGAQAVQVKEVQVPAQTSSPPYLIILLAGNLFLLIFVIILIFWLKSHYTHKPTIKEEKDIPKEEHIHPAPPELIAYVKGQFDRNKKLHDIRMELAGKGWTPSIIEHAIHAARER